jgi:hypothetical protein
VSFSFLRNPVLNADGHITFHGSLTGAGVSSANSSGIWSDSSGELELVARTGNHAPGTPDGVSFNGMFFPSVNAAGQIAFQGRTTGAPGLNGVWATDVNGILQSIVLAGDVLEVAPNDFRTVSTVTLGTQQQEAGSGNEDGRPSVFNDRGQIAFLASFTDGSSGVFVSDAVLNDGALPGDINSDGAVDTSDYLIWRKNYSDQAAGYNIWRANFGRSAASGSGGSTIPEPATLLSIAIACLGLLSGRCWEELFAGWVLAPTISVPRDWNPHRHDQHHGPQSANRVVGSVRNSLPAADRVVGTQLFVRGSRVRPRLMGRNAFVFVARLAGFVQE